MALLGSTRGWQCMGYFLFLLVNFFVRGEVQENFLNVPKVLLPYVPAGSTPTNFTLRALKGCFKWTSTRPEVAVVKPILSSNEQGFTEEESCGRSAIVTAQSASSSKETTVIIAEEEATGLTLRCDVFVDVVNRIDIATTTRELLLGENPEVFDVYGYDEEGNLFSSLGRLTFMWNLLPVSENNSLDPNSILKFLWFKDSSYETSAEVYSVESQGLRGSSILVEGINTGEALVSAKLQHSAYKDTKPSVVRLIVIDNIILLPSSDSYILVGTSVGYRVMQLRRGKPLEITMPSVQYQFALTDATIASLDPDRSKVTGQKLGSTKIILIDQNMVNTKSTRQPSANIHVVEPGRITFSVRPGNIWTLETGRVYAIRVHVFDKNNHEILISDNSILNSALSNEFFDIKEKTKNESYFITKAIKAGVVNIHSLLLGVKIEETGDILNLTKPVRGDQEVLICDPIIVSPKDVVIPWNPDIAADEHYQVKLTATGGCGSYTWSSLNSHLASVNSKGVVTTNNVIGSSEIKATDTKNAAHSGSSFVHVLPPDEMHFILVQVEAQVGSSLFLPLSVAAYIDKERKELVTFKDCSRLKLDIVFTKPHVFKVIDGQQGDNSLPNSACTGIMVEASTVGFTMVTATYNGVNGKKLKATITIGAYPPLKAIDPVDLATVTLASSRDIVLQGGPLPWILDPSGFLEQMLPEEEEWVSISSSDNATGVDDKEGNLHVFKVLCKQLGEQILRVQVGNHPTTKNIIPASSLVAVRYSCVPPSSLQLTPIIQLPTIDGHQMTIESCQNQNKEIPVRNNRELLIALIIRDANGMPISNATSLDVKWSTSDENLLQLLEKDENSQKDVEDMVAVYRMVSLSDHIGSVTLTANISAYQKIFLYAAGVFEKMEITPAISGHLKLLLVPEAQIAPSSLTLLSHPQNKVDLGIEGGSQHFVIKTNDENLASVEKSRKSGLMVSPLSTGSLEIILYDACLDALQPAKAVLTLEAIHSINVVVADKVELTKLITAVVQVFDASGNALSIVNMDLLHLTPRLSLDILEIRPTKETKKPQLYDKAVYDLKGLAVGVTSLTYHITEHNGVDISSHPEDIQVFPPLRLNPRHVILLSGATLQVQSYGGPRPQSTTVFLMQNETVAKVNTAGLVTAYVPGISPLKGMAQETDPNSGEAIVYSEDQITIEVIRIKGFKIFVPSRNIVSGSQVGIYAVGLSDEGPFTFASSPPYLQFHWSSANVDVSSLKSVYANTGVSVESEKDFRVTLNSLNPGHTAIRLKVEVTDNYANRIHPDAVMEDEVRIQVFEELKLLFPETGKLLLPHRVTTKLRTNRDGLVRLTYETITGCGATPSEPVVTISSNGEVNSLTSSGSVVVMVTSHEDFGFNQSVVVRIEVGSIASVSLRSLSSTRASTDKMHSFPLGTSAEFGVSLHDNIGREFDVSNVPIEHQVHRQDAVNVIRRINNASFSVKMTSVGDAILKVYCKYQPQIADYIRIRVHYGIAPTMSVCKLGEMSCFHLTTKCEGCKGGTWHSSNPQVLSVDPQKGIALANAVGNAIVTYAVPGVLMTYVEATVKGTTSLLLSSSTALLTNIGPTGRPSYKFEVTFDESEDGFKDCNGTVSTKSGLFKTHFPSECIIKTAPPLPYGLVVEDIFNTEAQYVDGKLFCEVRAQDMSSKALKSLFSEKRNILIQATVKDHQRETEITSNIETIKFVPGLLVSHSSVTILDKKAKDVIVIMGAEEQLQAIEVSISNPSLLVVQKMNEDFPVKDMYEVSLPASAVWSDYSPSHLLIAFKSGITGQSEEISVAVQLPYTPTPSEIVQPNCSIPPMPLDKKVTHFYNTLSESTPWLIIFTILIATLILVLLCYLAITIRKKNIYPVYSHATTPPPPYHTPATQFKTATQSPPPYHRSPAGTTPPRTLFSVSQ